MNLIFFSIVAIAGIIVKISVFVFIIIFTCALYCIVSFMLFLLLVA